MCSSIPTREVSRCNFFFVSLLVGCFCGLRIWPLSSLCVSVFGRSEVFCVVQSEWLSRSAHSQKPTPYARVRPHPTSPHCVLPTSNLMLNKLAVVISGAHHVAELVQVTLFVLSHLVQPESLLRLEGRIGSEYK